MKPAPPVITTVLFVSKGVSILFNKFHELRSLSVRYEQLRVAPNVFIIRPGLPAKTTLEGTDFVTTVPAPTTAFSPTSTPGRIIAHAPIQLPLLKVIELANFGSGYPCSNIGLDASEKAWLLV